MSVDEWKDFFINSGFQDTVASNYAHIFFNNRMRFELLSDLTKEYLKEMKITFIGDMMTILSFDDGDLNDLRIPLEPFTKDQEI